MPTVPRLVLFLLAMFVLALCATACCDARAYRPDPPPDYYMNVPSTDEPAWGLGLTQPRTLLRFRRYDASSDTPNWCRKPDELLEELEKVINGGHRALGHGCEAHGEDSAISGNVLEITCPLDTSPGKCRDTYSGRVWGDRYDNAPADYTLYGFGWVRRACAGSAGDFTPPGQVLEAAHRSSDALRQFLDQCR